MTFTFSEYLDDVKIIRDNYQTDKERFDLREGEIITYRPRSSNSIVETEYKGIIYVKFNDGVGVRYMTRAKFHQYIDDDNEKQERRLKNEKTI